jgi:hypothetical protein
VVPERKLQIHAISLYSFNNEREQILAGCQVSVTYIFIVRERTVIPWQLCAANISFTPTSFSGRVTTSIRFIVFASSYANSRQR